MENNKTEHCESHSCCKHHRIIVPLVLTVLLIAVFAFGVAVGHEGEREGFRGEGGYERGGCGRGNFLRGENGSESDYRNNAKEQTEKTDKAKGVEATTTKENLTATSTAK